MKSDALSYKEIESALGHAFNDRSLIARALTHRSFASSRSDEDYQRLEFLGDRVLGLVIAALLYVRFPAAPEGKLSRCFSHLVSKDSCAFVAERLNVSAYVRVGKGERRDGIYLYRTILGDVCEAILGAIYLDAGFVKAEEAVLRFWEKLLPETLEGFTDPRTQLQEWAHANGLSTPVYQETGRSGPDHDPVFCIAVRVDGKPAAEAQGASKSEAAREAAKVMLIQEGLLTPETCESDT